MYTHTLTLTHIHTHTHINTHTYILHTHIHTGVVGTTRFCSSRDMSAQCQFIRYPDHNRVYRACIHTCQGDACNGASQIVTSLASVLLVAVVGLLVAI